MKTKLFSSFKAMPLAAALFASLLLASTLLAACAGPLAGGQGAAAAQAGPSQTPGVVEPTATPPPSPTQLPTTTQTPTQDAALLRAQQAEQAARAYFDAVAAGESQQAAELLSSFGLMVFQMTRGDAVSALQAQKIDGVRWSDLAIQDTQPFDEQTLLVHVSYTQTHKESSTSKDELWPLRLENGAWRYNWENLIDFRSLDARAQTVNGVTVMPLQLNRYSDRLQLTLMIQNRTNAVVVFGQANENLGTFYFGEQAVIAEKVQLILNPLRSVPSAALEIKGLFTSYPDTVQIRQWIDYDVAPWYTFQLQ